MLTIWMQQYNRKLILGSTAAMINRQKMRYFVCKKESPDELVESFYQNLEFGTGGLRGIMGVGTNRINRYTVGMCTQGFANYLKKNFDGTEIKWHLHMTAATKPLLCRNNCQCFCCQRHKSVFV